MTDNEIETLKKDLLIHSGGQIFDVVSRVNTFLNIVNYSSVAKETVEIIDLLVDEFSNKNRG